MVVPQTSRSLQRQHCSHLIKSWANNWSVGWERKNCKMMLCSQGSPLVMLVDKNIHRWSTKIGRPTNTSERKACDGRIGSLVSWCGLTVGADGPSVHAQSDPRSYVTKWNPPKSPVSADGLCVRDIVILCFIWLSILRAKTAKWCSSGHSSGTHGLSVGTM